MSSADGWDLTVPEDAAELLAELRRHGVRQAVGHRRRTTLAAAGLNGVEPHDLRHFYASGSLASGCDVVTVQRPSDMPAPPRR